ncbi:MAG: heme exporter protein CcmB [Candidatus Hydrothermales bacterium]
MKQIIYLIKKDVLLEFRTKEIIIPYLLFSFLLLFLLSFGVERIFDLKLFSFFYFLSFMFAGMLGFERVTALEFETGGIYSLLTFPIPRNYIFISKTLSMFLFQFFSGVILMIIFSVFLNVNFPPIFYFLIIIILFSFGFSILGVILSFLTFSSRAREFLLPIVLIPLFIPPFVSATFALNTLLEDKFLNLNYIYFLVFFDVFYFFISDLLFEYVILE